MLSETQKPQRMLEVLERERGVYGDFDLHGSMVNDPFGLLIQTMLSHRVPVEDEQAVYDALRRRYRTWEAVESTDTAELARTISLARYPDVKAKHIKNTLGRIRRKFGDYTLAPIGQMTPADAFTWLTSLPGVALRTAQLVMLCAFKVTVLPVDLHVIRVMQRIGIIDRKATPDKARQQLQKLLPDDPATLYAFHRATMIHGQKVCHHNNPRCGKCPLNDVCEYYEQRTGGPKNNLPPTDADAQLGKGRL